MISSFAIAVGLAWHGYRKGSLSLSGAFGAWIVGWVTFIAGPLFAAVLITFYACGSFATGIKWQVKQQLVHEEQVNDGEVRVKSTTFQNRKHGNRNIWQVLSNALTPTLICAYHRWITGSEWPILADRQSSVLLAAYLGAYACNMGDTLASELGILSTGDPWMITNFQRVPRGTNGAISLMGTLASAFGGIILAVAVSAALWLHGTEFTWWPTGICITSAVGGMLLDSLLGATVQASYYDTSKGQVWNSLPSSPARQRNFKRIAGRWEVLSNNQVNAISSALTATTAAVKILNLAKI